MPLFYYITLCDLMIIIHSNFQRQRYYRRQTSSLRFVFGVARHLGAVRRMVEGVGT